MEEELKRIEYLIERCNQCKLNACITCDICLSEVQAIKDLIENYNNLVKVSRETAFDDQNNDTELLCRVLLKQGHIELNEEKHEYVNPAKDEEFQVYGIMYTKEKIFLLDDDKLDDYTKQLEWKVKDLKEENVKLIRENKTLKETEPVSIPISVIQNKLEQNKAKTDCRYCNNACDSYAVCTVLKEILEKGNK